VADYKPAKVSATKIKKKNNGDDLLHLELIKTKDILSEMGKQKQQQLLVGFALETNNLIEYATEKVKSKNLDLIIANSAIEKGAGFGTETNKITIIDKHNKISNFELKSKQEVAIDIVNYLIDLLNKK
jgi:phosphopantothenoylcysteine decarboxylase/phosphopantothenate--cysteine ligase